MSGEFQPAYQHFQRDIERYLTSTGKREKRGDGTLVFRGYDDALQKIFRLYLDHGAFDPLVAHFRAWNWEVGDNEFLLELTAALLNRRDWPLLQRLWDGVIAKRRKHYNQVWKIEKHTPGTLPSKTMDESKALLLETLSRVKTYADELDQQDAAEHYSQMIARVQSGKKA